MLFAKKFCEYNGSLPKDQKGLKNCLKKIVEDRTDYSDNLPPELVSRIQNNTEKIINELSDLLFREGIVKSDENGKIIISKQKRSEFGNSINKDRSKPFQIDLSTDEF